MREAQTKGIRGIAKRLLPSVILRELRQLWAYSLNERPVYLKVRIANALGLKNLKTSRAPETARKLLFVCFGNIMRSPMCEALMHRELRSYDPLFGVASAGLHATDGRPAHEWAIVAAKRFEISLETHRAQRLTGALVEEADAIFVMDYQNLVQLSARWPTAGKKTFMLAAYADPEYRPVEIPDPYYLGEHETHICFNVLNTCVRNVALSLAGSNSR